MAATVRTYYAPNGERCMYGARAPGGKGCENKAVVGMLLCNSKIAFCSQHGMIAIQVIESLDTMPLSPRNE